MICIDRVLFHPDHTTTIGERCGAMTMSEFFKLYAVALTVFLIIDLIWLGVVARSFYQAQMGHLMRANVNWGAAIIFYLIFVAGIVLLVVWPAIERQSLVHAITFGAVLGLITYAAYDLTNLATIEGWPIMVVVIDVLWGMFITGVTAGLTTFITSLKT